MDKLIYKDEVYKLNGIAMKVYNELGFGFLESVYQEAFEIELKRENIPYKREYNIDIYYDNVKLQKGFRADFLCYDKIIVELKASSGLIGKDESQLINYLKATGIKVGTLYNFGTSSLEYRRLIF